MLRFFKILVLSLALISPSSKQPVQQSKSPTPATAPSQNVHADVRVLSTPSKDRYDKASVWINATLALVGGAGVLVALFTLCYLRRQAFEMALQRRAMVRTLSAIKKQADLMERQNQIAAESVNATKDAANAAYGSVRFAEAHLEMEKEKERARLSFERGKLEAQNTDSEFWHLVANIEIRNLGRARAFLTRTEGALSVTEAEAEQRPSEEEDAPHSLDFPDGFIDPSTTPIVVSMYLFNDKPASLKDFADDLHEGRKVLKLRGFIEYESIGMKFREDFKYFWMAGGFARGLFGEETRTLTDAERVVDGNWWKSWDAGSDAGSDDEVGEV